MPPSQMRSSVSSTSSKKRASPRAQPGPPEHFEHRGLRKFRRAAQAAVAPDRSRRRAAARRGRVRRAPITTLPCRARALVGEPRHQGGAVLVDACRLFAEQPRDLAQHVDESRAAVARRLRKISAAPDRLAVGGEKHGQRPAALLAQMMQRRHVDLVDVGALLAIDFDVDEQLVHHRGGGGILEAFVRHDVAPVAGGVADRQQDRLVGALRLGQRLRSPWPPVDRIVLVLQQIRAGFLRQAVFCRGRVACGHEVQCSTLLDKSLTVIGRIWSMPFLLCSAMTRHVNAPCDVAQALSTEPIGRLILSVAWSAVRVSHENTVSSCIACRGVMPGRSTRANLSQPAHNTDRTDRTRWSAGCQRASDRGGD